MKKRRILLSLILTFMLLFSQVVPVSALEATLDTTTDTTTEIVDGDVTVQNGENDKAQIEIDDQKLKTQVVTNDQNDQTQVVTNDQNDQTQVETNDQNDQTQVETNDQNDQTQVETNDQNDQAQAETNDQNDQTQVETNDQNDQTQVETNDQNDQTQVVTDEQKLKTQVETNESKPEQNQVLRVANDITWTNKGEFPFVTKVKISNENGVEIGEGSFDRNQKINLDFYFSIPNDAVVSAGDMYTIAIPDGFELVGNLSEQQLDETSGIDVTWELTDNVITIRFYQSLDILSNVSGYMSIGCWFDKDSQLGQDGQDITFVIAGQTYTVDVYYDEITDSQSADVVKKGTYNKETKEVTWTITVTPDNKNATLSGVTVKDYFDTSVLKYVQGSFKVNGSTIADSNVIFNTNGFEYKFPAETSPGAKTITYKTAVADGYFMSDAKTVKNNVSTYMPNGDKSSEAEAEVTVEKLPMQKASVKYNAITKTGSWKIVANRNKLSLKDATIVDNYPKGTYIDTDTIKVDGKSTQNYKVDSNKNTLTIYLGDIDDEVVITYDMVITDFDQLTKYEDTYYIRNYASLNSGNSVIEDATGEGWIGIGTGNIPIEKSGKVKIDDTYGQYIEWWVEINGSYSSDYKEITDPIVFYDKLPEGTSFIPWGLVITAYFPDGTKASKTIDTSEVYNSKTNEVSYTITPGMDFSGVKATADCTYGIWFATSINGVQEGSFTNTAKVTVDNNTNSDTATVDVSYKTGDMIGKSGSYNYENNTYDWTIQFNKGEQAVLNPVITDSLPSDHVPAYDYIYVDEQKVLLDGTKVNGISATYDAGNNVVKVSFEGYILSASKIYISTKYVGEGTQGDAKNNVELKGDNFSHSFTATATVKYKPLPILQKKTDYTSGDTITWKVVLNLDHDNLGQLSLVDQLSPGLDFDTSSVKLYLANISSNGTITSTNTQVEISESGIKFDPTTGLITIVLPKDLDTHQCYILNFDTPIKDKDLKSITNSITFNGTDFQEGTTSEEVILKTTSSSSGIVGEAGTVRIKKLDQKTNKPLEGVPFQLLDKNKNVITSAGWAVTDSNGIAEFKDWLRLDSIYYVQEVRTLQGYLYDDTLYEVKVNSSDETKVVEITVYNIPDERINIKGSKTWEDGNNQDGIRPESITVNLLANGKVVKTATVTEEDNWSYAFSNLPKYANGKEIVYTVSEEEVTGYEVKVDGYNIINTHVPETISVEGSKTWEDGNNQDGIRPESITVNLLANGKVVKTATVTEEDNWSYAFSNLPKYANGKEIVYTVSEEEVTGYEVKVDGYNLINTHVPKAENETTPNTNNNDQNLPPKTGDHVDIMLFVIIGTVSFIQMIIVCILKKKKTLK